MQLLDEVMTSDGRGKVVGFPSDTQVEVRLIEQGGLLIKDKTEVTEIGDQLQPPEYELLTIDPPQTEPEGLVPVGKNGRPLRGIALRNYLRTHPEEGP